MIPPVLPRQAGDASKPMSTPSIDTLSHEDEIKILTQTCRFLGRLSSMESVRIQGGIARIISWRANQKNHTRCSVEERLGSIEATLTRMQKKAEGQDNRTTSYAAVTANGYRAYNGATVGGRVPCIPHTHPYDPRKAKSMIVHLKDPEERLLYSRVPNAELLKRIQTGLKHEGTKDIVGARHLPSGDIIANVASEKVKEGLENNVAWLKDIANSAIIKRQTFPVLVHGTKIREIDTSDQKEAARKIIEQNKRLHPDLKIMKLGWSAQTLRSRKIYSSFIIELTTAEQANRVIKEGLVVENELINTELFDRNCRIQQCYRCNGYGHTRRTCKREDSCGHCAGDHAINVCDAREDRDPSKCVNCRGGHPAWSTECKYRRKKSERVKRNLQERATLYPTQNEHKGEEYGSMRNPVSNRPAKPIAQ